MKENKIDPVTLERLREYSPSIVEFIEQHCTYIVDHLELDGKPCLELVRVKDDLIIHCVECGKNATDALKAYIFDLGIHKDEVLWL